MPNIRNLMTSARRLFPDAPYLDPEAVRHLRRGYVRARLRLGGNWVLAQGVRKHVS